MNRLLFLSTRRANFLGVRHSILTHKLPLFLISKNFSSTSPNINPEPNPPPIRRSFKAETQRLLQIVADSLYSEKEVFIRELLSNSSDACEKLKYYQLTDPKSVEISSNAEFSIKIRVDPERNTFILEDNGIGMDFHELDENLGTIALSGASAFLSATKLDKNAIIGQFGVGFYSAFTVAKKIEVYSKSARSSLDAPVHLWSCETGDSDYTLSTIPHDDPVLEGSFTYGTRIVIHLKEEESKYALETSVKDLIKKYSNFLPFPIYLNETKVNTLLPLWTFSKNDITDEQYKDFFKYISEKEGTTTDSSFKYSLLYSTDAPVQMRSLLFVPNEISSLPFSKSQDHDSPQISLYCKKVLIKEKADDLLPQWLSFIRGVVDSEDIPLNLSRELLQNSLLLSKIRKTLTSRIIKWLLDEQRQNPLDFANFYKKIAPYIKGGIMSEDKKEVSQLLMFESSALLDAPMDNSETTSGKGEETSSNGETSPLTTLKSYVERMQPDQKEIYILLAKNRNAAMKSPYYEPFRKRKLEVLFSYDPLDEFIVPSLDGIFDGISVKRIEDVKLASLDSTPLDTKLSETEISDLVSFLRKVFPTTAVQNIKASNRFSNHPALFVDHALQSTTFKYFKQMMALQANDSSNNLFNVIPPLDLEINPEHPLMKNIFWLMEKNPSLATLVSLQVLDNARIEAGLLEDTHEMVARITSLLEALTKPVEENTHFGSQ